MAGSLISAWRRRVLAPVRGWRYRSIRTVMVTGSVGKTTTCRMVTRILDAAGHTVGLTTTDDVRIAGQVVARGDSAGYHGASRILRDKAVTAAVLETARGDILQRGLYLSRVDVGALLNVHDEQLGLSGVETVEQLGDVKKAVCSAATKAIVLSADNAICQSIASRYPLDKLILFSMRPEAEPVKKHLAAGGQVLTLSSDGGENWIVRRRGASAERIVALTQLPAAMGGILRHNVENALAAAAVATGLSLPHGVIAAGLSRFSNSVEDSPGRFNVLDGYPFRIVADRAASVPGIKAVIDATKRMPVSGRRFCMFTARGNRSDKSYRDLAACVAHRFEQIICYEDAKFLRGRAEGEILQFLSDGLRAAGVSESRFKQAPSCADALGLLRNMARQDDLILVLGSYIQDVQHVLQEAFGD